MTSTQTAQPSSTPSRGEQRESASPPRGAKPTTPERPWFQPGMRWIAFFVVLLVLDSLFTMQATAPAARVRVP